jgi:hypothetical protein
MAIEKSRVDGAAIDAAIEASIRNEWGEYRVAVRQIESRLPRFAGRRRIIRGRLEQLGFTTHPSVRINYVRPENSEGLAFLLRHGDLSDPTRKTGP